MELILAAVEEVRREFAPDPRTAVYEIDVVRDARTLSIAGATSAPAAVEALRWRLAELEPGMAVRDEVLRLPLDSVAGTPYALVSAAIAPLLAGPIITETHLSQTLLGSRVTLLREHRRWLQCRAADGYIGWIHRGYLVRVDEQEARAWELGMGGTPCLSLGAEVVDESEAVAARLPWGSRFLLRDGHAVLPDARVGSVRGEVILLAEQAERFPAQGDAIVRTASRWTGAPYLWGGVTPAGVDCSGLVQAVFRTHGIELPRDSDQQAREGEDLPIAGDMSALEPGDLLFFAEEGTPISHVAISLGGSRILHAALGSGGVGYNDLAGETAFERELHRLLVGARRVLSSAG